MPLHTVTLGNNIIFTADQAPLELIDLIEQIESMSADTRFHN